MTDKRIKLITELIEGVDLIKMYAWDDEIENLIIQLRKKELEQLYKIYDL